MSTTITAKAATDFSLASTWNGGIVPTGTANDGNVIADLNGFAVTFSKNIGCSSITDSVGTGSLTPSL